MGDVTITEVDERLNVKCGVGEIIRCDHLTTGIKSLFSLRGKQRELFVLNRLFDFILCITHFKYGNNRGYCFLSSHFFN